MAAASTALRLLFVPHLPTSAAVPVRLRGPPLLLPLRSLSSSLPRSRSRLSPVVFAQSNLFKGSSIRGLPATGWYHCLGLFSSHQYQLGCGLAAAREKEEEGDEEGKPRDLVPLSLNNPDPLLPSFVIADEEKTLPPPLLLVASDEEKNATSSRCLICQQAMMGLVYFVFVSLNTDELSTRSKITTSNEEETLEEARRIMEKYK
ncbi:hypothetical protein BHM03_00033917 [Ensete ventricosum]|nr:hypothetical protein BHM03_00033917 [Ensete ventricosum]